MKVFLPYRGEFGIGCWFHVPQVHAALEPGVDVVCCEQGKEALYPGAADYVHPPARADAERRPAPEPDVCGACSRVDGCLRAGVATVAPDMAAPRVYFTPRPHVKQGVRADVVVCPRKRAYGPDKNWPHWQMLIDSLRGDGYIVHAAGAPDSSFDVKRCARAWDYERPLDASIQAMHSAELVIATDAGLAHLAVLCGRPLIMLTHAEGLVAPGSDDVGKPYWPVKRERYDEENHTDCAIQLLHHAWDRPESAVFMALSWMRARMCAELAWRVR